MKRKNINNGRVLVIGCYGNVGTAGIFSLVQIPGIEVHALVRDNDESKEKFQKVSNAVLEKTGKSIRYYYGDASNKKQLLSVIEIVKPEILVHWGLPFDNLVIMEACLMAGVHYIDTACYEDSSQLGFSYEKQWAMDSAFKDNNLLALTGCGFDPGWTNAVCGYAREILFDEVHEVHIFDANAGSHGQPMAANFNPVINFREFLGEQCCYWHEGNLKRFGYLHERRGPRCKHNFLGVGKYKASMIYHEELETVPRHMPHLKKMSFWMTFSDKYLDKFSSYQEDGLLGTEPIAYNGIEIKPIEFLAKCLPKPESFNHQYVGKTHIGVIFSGVRKGKRKFYYIFNISDHHEAFLATGSNAIGFTTAIPTVAAIKMFFRYELWATGVRNMEDHIFAHGNFLDMTSKLGLPWQIKKLPDLPEFLKRDFQREEIEKMR